MDTARLPDGVFKRLAEQKGKPEEMHGNRGMAGPLVHRGNPPIGQTAFSDSAKSALNSRLVAEYDVSQFYFMLLLVTTLMLTACFGVAAWRLSGESSEVTGSVLQHLIDTR